MPTNLPDVRESCTNSECQKGGVKQFCYWGATFLEWPMNLTVIWQFLPHVCVCVWDLVHFFCTCRRKCSDRAKNVGHIRAKFSCPGHHLLGIGASLLRVMISDSLVQLWRAQRADGGCHCFRNNKTFEMKARFMRLLLWHCSNCFVTSSDDRTLCNNECNSIFFFSHHYTVQ